MRWGYDQRCGLCGGKQGTWQHYIDFSPRTRTAPPALRYAGNVPTRYFIEPGSVQMRKPTECGHEKVAGVPQYGGTQARSKQRVVGRRGGWGVFLGAGDPHNQWGPVQGNVQKSARVAVYAALQATRHAAMPIVIVTGSMRGLTGTMLEGQSALYAMTSGRFPSATVCIEQGQTRLLRAERQCTARILWHGRSGNGKCAPRTHEGLA